MQIETNKIFKFANRLRYIPVDNLPIGMCVDHVNKEYDKNNDIYNILFDILLWNTPQFVYNVIKLSLKNCFGYDMTNCNLTKAILFSDNIIISSTKYRNSDINRILHPCVDTSLRSNFGKVMTILLSKAFDEEDGYFNPTKDKSIINFKFEHIYKRFLINASYKDLTLSGSNALAFYGEVFRNEIKDFDFLVDDSYLPKEIYDIVNEEISYNKIVGKDRIKVENKVKELFENSRFYNELSVILDNKLSILAAVIDRVAEYDNLTKVTFILKYIDIEFDLIFRHNLEFNITNIDDYTIRIQNINDILYAKKLLGRPKDFQDLINFKPYSKLNNNFKCVVNYG